MRVPARLEAFEALADDILAGYGGDTAALERLTAHFGVNYAPGQLRVRVERRVDGARGSAEGAPTLEDVRATVAAIYGFESWARLVESVKGREAGPRAPGAPSPRPHFYRIDPHTGAIEARPPLTPADWDHVLAVMRERGISAIRTSALTDAAAERLSRLEPVTSVDVDGAQSLSDEGVLRLASMPQLEELALGGWHSPITDRGLGVLAHLPKLRRFSMSWAQRITDDGVAPLRDCPDLERVHLMGTPTGDGALRALAGKARLADLRTGKRVTDAGIAAIHELPRFRAPADDDVELDLMAMTPSHHTLLLDGPVTDAGIRGLVGLEGVVALNLFWHAKRFTGAGLAVLAELPHLVHLGCWGEQCDDAAMRSVGTLPRLRGLMAQGTVASDDGFVALSASRTLEHLWGRECPNLGARGFRALAGMPALEGLGVSLEGVDDEALAALGDFPALRRLVPMDLHDDGFRHVGTCERLEHLVCMYCRDTGDRATDHIASLRLRGYYAGATRITDRSLELLAGMETLEKIELVGTAGVTAAGLAVLRRLPHLLELSVSEVPGVTEQATAGFRPEVVVDVRAQGRPGGCSADRPASIFSP